MFKKYMKGMFIFDLFDDLEEIKKEMQEEEDKDFSLEPNEMDEDCLFY